MLVPDKTTYYLTALANHPRQEEFFAHGRRRT